MTELTLMGIFTWLATSVGAIAVASWVCERWNWFQALESSAKEYGFFGVVVVIACASKAILLYVPVDVLSMIAPWFELIAGIFVALFLGKAYHKIDKKEKTVDVSYGLVDYE
jgi:tetrahydromethanopterin S-methyltransferase subunit H